MKKKLKSGICSNVSDFCRTNNKKFKWTIISSLFCKMLGKETRMDLKLLKNFFYIFVHLLLWNRPITSNIWVKLTKNTHDYYLIRHVIFAYCWNKCLGLIICLGFLLFYLIYNRKYMFSSQIHQVVGVLFLGLSVILKK